MPRYLSCGPEKISFWDADLFAGYERKIFYGKVNECLWLAKLADSSQHSSGGSLVSPIGKKDIPLAGSARWITKN